MLSNKANFPSDRGAGGRESPKQIKMAELETLGGGSGCVMKVLMGPGSLM